jgi:hypothetical protein
MLLEASLASGRHTHMSDPSLRHVLNGDAMQFRFGQSGVPGVWTIWREAVIDGPVALDMASAEFCAVRAQALAKLYGINARDYADDFEVRERFLAECPDGSELVLWFEADCFCELHLLDLLGRSSARPGLRVSVVHMPREELEPERLRAEFERRCEASLACRSEAREAWRSYCDADPRVFVGFRCSDPWLAEIMSALQHDFVGRFPDSRGLSRFDASMLTALGARRGSPLSLFERSHSEPELARLGLGDLQVWNRLEDLEHRGLLTLLEPLPKGDEPVDLHAPTIEATALGRAVLAGKHIAASPRGPIGGADPSRWERDGDALLPL